MARRKKDSLKQIEQIAMSAAYLAAIGVVACIVHPPLKAALARAGWGLIAVLCSVYLGRLAFRYFKNRIALSIPSSDSVIPEMVSSKTHPAKSDPPPPRSFKTLEEQLAAIDWFQFEKLMEIVYQKQGYEVTRRGGANPDGGIDLVLQKDGERIAVQCKCWRSWDVGVAKTRELAGAMADARIAKGILATTTSCTTEARAFAGRNGICILNLQDVLKLLDDVDAKYDPRVQTLLNDTRKMCPKCESEMILRTAKKGANAGSQFWGCSSYPRCSFIMPCRN